MKVIHNGTDVCSRAYSLAISDAGEVFFTDVDARKIGKVIEGNTAEYTIGSEGETPHDGCDKTAAFVQTTGLCMEGDSLYLTDKGAGALKLISPTKPVANFLKHVRLLYTSHGIHSPPASLTTATCLLDDTTSYFETAVEEAKLKAGGRRTAEGPHGVPSPKTVASIRMTLEVLCCIEKELTSINPSYIKHVNPKSLVTLIVEHFNFKMDYQKIWLVLKNCLTSLIHPNITAHSKTCPQCESGQRSMEDCHGNLLYVPRQQRITRAPFL